MKPYSISRRSIVGLTLPDLLVSTAISSVIAAAMFLAISSLQRSSAASNHYAKSQAQQSRLIDYIARDLRRALSVNVDSYNGAKRLNMTIPDYYDGGGNARDAVISSGGVAYGTIPVPISYYKVGGKVFRNSDGVAEVLASDVDQFAIDFTDSGKQTVGVSISFVPRYQLNPNPNASVRDGTAAYATTLLRNKRTP